MSLRRLIVELDPKTINVTAFCREHGISTWFFWDLRRRAERDPSVVDGPGSRAPRRVANRTDDQTIELMVEIRKELVDQGVDAGPESVHDVLADRLDGGPGCPSVSTIYRHLRARGFITPEPRKAPQRTWRRFVSERANERWQIDATHWPLADDTEVEIINVIDDCTRVCVASLAVKSCTTATAFEAMTIGACQWGWPEGVLSDNASAFRGRFDAPHLGGLAVALRALGITSGRSRPFHPQTCGKVERFHQTLKRHLATRTPAATIPELQTQLDAYLDHYNHRRRHRSLNRRRPAEVFADTPCSGPASRPLHSPVTVHHSDVAGGAVWAGRRYRISIGSAYEHQRATITITGTTGHVFIDGHLIRQLELDPTREYQGLRSTVRDVPRQP